MKQRIKWIDIAKGITIILVVIGHLNIKMFPEVKPIIDFIYTFHMPLFFLLSGLTFSIDRNNGFWTFFKKKFKRLMTPYFAFSILIFIKPIGNACLNFIKEGLINGQELLETAKNVFVFGNGFWFLPCLLIAECILFVIIKMSKDGKKQLGMYIILFSIVGYLYTKFCNIALPFKINTAIVAVVYVGIGYLIKNTKIIEGLKQKKVLLFNILLNITLNIIGYQIYGKTTDMGIATNYFIFYITAFSGTFFVIGVSQYLQNITFMEFLGKNSLIIYLFNDIVLKVYKAVIVIILKIQTQELMLGYQYIVSIVLVTLTIITMIPIIKIINSYFPFLLGNTRVKSKE